MGQTRLCKEGNEGRKESTAVNRVICAWKMGRKKIKHGGREKKWGIHEMREGKEGRD